MVIVMAMPLPNCVWNLINSISLSLSFPTYKMRMSNQMILPHLQYQESDGGISCALLIHCSVACNPFTEQLHEHVTYSITQGPSLRRSYVQFNAAVILLKFLLFQQRSSYLHFPLSPTKVVTGPVY